MVDDGQDIKQEELFIGLMSGTSIDGIDATLVAFESANKLRVIETLFTEFDQETRNEIYHTAQNNQHLRYNEDSALHASLASKYALACKDLLKKAQISPDAICAIANHGQTVKHEPLASPPYSLQLGDGQRLANLTGIKTFTQFRQADLAAGGQGAPLMPAFHKSVFGGEQNAIILNIGGIANVTRLKTPVIGFDTGPGNVLLDQWIEHCRRLPYDKDGEWAQQGQLNTALLESLISDPYFSKSFPKSIGTDYFNLAWLESRFGEVGKLPQSDVQRTLVQLSIESIAKEIDKVKPEGGFVYVCGGGAKNPLIMDGLRSRLVSFEVQATDAIGIPSDWVEAVGFAWLGYCCAHGIESNLPSVTGASSAVILGEEFYPQ